MSHCTSPLSLGPPHHQLQPSPALLPLPWRWVSPPQRGRQLRPAWRLLSFPGGTAGAPPTIRPGCVQPLDPRPRLTPSLRLLLLVSSPSIAWTSACHPISRLQSARSWPAAPPSASYSRATLPLGCINPPSASSVVDTSFTMARLPCNFSFVPPCARRSHSHFPRQHGPRRPPCTPYSGSGLLPRCTPLVAAAYSSCPAERGLSSHNVGNARAPLFLP